MKQLVIMPGGFHPFHAGHRALYDAAVQAFPDADVYVAATNDTSERPFPFSIKRQLARLAGIDPGKFVQVKSPFRAQEITQQYDPNDTVLIFVRSNKDRDKPPQAGGIKKDGTPAYLQPLTNNPAAMSSHAYMTYLPTVEFANGLTSATEIRTAWPQMPYEAKAKLVRALYPRIKNNADLLQQVIRMLDAAIVGDMSEGQGWAATLEQSGQMVGTPASGLQASYQRRENQPVAEDYIDEASWSKQYKKSINCNRPRGFSQKAHCAGRRARQAGKKTKSSSVMEQALLESKLAQHCEIRTNFPEADFWLVRRGSENDVGRPTRTFGPEHIGIKVVDTDKIMPDYLYYFMQYLHGRGVWKPMAHGTLNLKNIRTDDVRSIPVG